MYDIRLSGRNQIPIVFLDDDSEVQLPTKKEVCAACRGNGTHVNPSIDSHGISAEEMAEDPDFAESYMRGDYDVTCYVCGGLRVVDVVDEDRCDAQLLQRYQDQQRERAQDEAAERAERAFCGDY